jgi:hypothetical protein
MDHKSSILNVDGPSEISINDVALESAGANFDIGPIVSSNRSSDIASIIASCVGSKG